MRGYPWAPSRYPFTPARPEPKPDPTHLSVKGRRFEMHEIEDARLFAAAHPWRGKPRTIYAHHTYRTWPYEEGA